LITNNIFSLKGVLIEPNEEIFSYHYNYGDDFNSIYFSFPRGFPISFIRSVVPLGSLEQEIIFKNKELKDVMSLQ